MDFGCYGADWAMLLKGRPKRVYATSLKLKTDQHNAVEDDATVLLEYPDATEILMPSWDWSYGKGQAEIFGSKGSFLVRGDGLLFQPAKGETSVQNPDGKLIETQPAPPEKRNGVAYFLFCIRNNKPIEGLSRLESTWASTKSLTPRRSRSGPTGRWRCRHNRGDSHSGRSPMPRPGLRFFGGSSPAFLPNNTLTLIFSGLVLPHCFWHKRIFCCYVHSPERYSRCNGRRSCSCAASRPPTASKHRSAW